MRIDCYQLVLLNPDLSVFENTVDPDQLASEEGSKLFSTLLGYMHINEML